MIQLVHRAFIKLTTLAAVVALFCLGLVLYYATQRTPPITYIGNPVAVEVGDDLVRLSFDVRRHRFDCEAKLTRYLLDADGFRFDFSPRQFAPVDINELEKRGAGKVLVLLPIPKGARRGLLIYSVKLEYDCDPLSHWWPIVVSYTVPFTIQKESP